MRPIFVHAVLATILSLPAFAQTAPDMVITATRLPAAVLDVPAGVTVIDRATLDTFGVNDLVQALAATPGLRIAQSG
ncbi:MAG: TonB-dependent receptor, partial [Acetobacteraceae bacterium]|nr:TonB-dependent receptor [Acetobacteraceae bacterium]